MGLENITLNYFKTSFMHDYDNMRKNANYWNKKMAPTAGFEPATKWLTVSAEHPQRACFVLKCNILKPPKTMLTRSIYRSNFSWCLKLTKSVFSAHLNNIE